MIFNGDCREELAKMEPASVDAIVCDPPYGLGFMGKGWDHGVPGVEFWEAALRVLKPGGHLVAFGGTRTFHRLTCAIEDAGFEIRDCLSWLYGTGFPKSLDVSKAIDKRRDDVEDVRVVCRWLRARIEEHPTHTIKTIAEHFGFDPRMADHWAARDTDSQPTLPKLVQWDTLRELLGFSDEMDPEVLRLNLRKGEPGEAWADREFYDEPTGGLHGGTGNTVGRFTGRQAKPGGVTDAAKQWDGWGTALKPAWEPIILARKPLVGTVAANVLKHGTGAVNVDGTRIVIPKGDKCVGGASSANSEKDTVVYAGGGYDGTQKENTVGRWPANVVLDEGAAGRLGEPSRFFYCAKASKSERGEGNNHPTVKPIALMRWLVRLVTPPGGLVLDPFCGSGSTGVAARAEGFRFIGIDTDEHYCKIARRRTT